MTSTFLPEEPPFEAAPIWYDSDMASSWEAGRQAGWDAAAAEQNSFMPEEPPFEAAPIWYDSDMASSWEAGRQAGWDAAAAS